MERKKTEISGFVLTYYDLQNEVSHDRSTFKFCNLLPQTLLFGVGGETPDCVKKKKLNITALTCSKVLTTTLISLKVMFKGGVGSYETSFILYTCRHRNILNRADIVCY